MNDVNALSHSLWLKLIAEDRDINWMNSNGVSRFFYKKRLESLLEYGGTEAVADALYTIATSAYTSQEDKQGLLRLGFEEEEADNAINEYQAQVIDAIARIRKEYEDVLQEFHLALDKRYEEAVMDNDDLKYYEGANYVDSSYTAKHSYKVDIPKHHIQYTSYFHYFIQNRKGYRYTLTQLKSIEYAIKAYIRNKKRNAFDYLVLVVGKTNARRILKVREGLQDMLVNDPGKLNVSRKVKAKIRRELRKHYYQLYRHEFEDYYTNSEYEEEVDIKYLDKYNML